MDYTYDRKPTTPSARVDWVENEVLTKEVRAAIVQLVRNLTREGQEVHTLLSKRAAWARTHIEDGDKITSQDVQKAVTKVVTEAFGEDALAQAVAQAIATGDGFF